MHIADDYEIDGEWDEFAFEDDDTFDPTEGPYAPGDAVRAVGFPGVICRVRAYRRNGMAEIRMVGDDHSYYVDPADLSRVAEDEVCACGQESCMWANV